MVLNEDLVSIIMPAYNAEKYIEEAIESVINQTYTNWELIIINDCSTDKTIEKVKKIKEFENRIKIIDLLENSGAAVSRNMGLDLAKGQYVAFLDSDDKWTKNKLVKQIDFMKKNGYSFTFTSYKSITDSTNESVFKFNAANSYNYKELLKNNGIGCLTVIIDREIHGDFKMPLIRKGQDHLTWLELLKDGGKAYGLSEFLAYYRRVPGSLSNNKFKALKRQWYNYRKQLNFSFSKSVYYFCCYLAISSKKYGVQMIKGVKRNYD